MIADEFPPCLEMDAMLGPLMPYQPNEFDRKAFEIYVPNDHHLRKALKCIDWSEFYDLLAPFYSETLGQPSEPPVLMLKLEYLRYHYNLSDSQVILRSTTDLAFRMFLQVDSYNTLPDSSSLCRFRARLKADGFRMVFEQVVAQARQHHLVKERLRIKDATHVIANIDAPSALALVAQIRDQLLVAAAAFDAERVEGERINIDILRDRSGSQKAELRLEARVIHLKDILAWVDALPLPADAASNKSWQTLVERRRLAHQILENQEHSNSSDKIRSVTDPDARRAKHGEWFDGYLLDIILDADSQIITQFDVLPANGEEAANAIALLEREEAVHGNDVAAVSIDGIGFNGPVLRELEAEEGLNVDVYVPPRKDAETGLFPPRDFVEDTDTGDVTCPAGQTSATHYRENGRHRTTHRFAADACRSCPLMSQCLGEPPAADAKYGRMVCKSDYEPEHERARAKATTEAYREIRREHWAVERKLGEVMNCHGGRRARSRGHTQMFIQEAMACVATNVKRIINLLSVEQSAQTEGT